MEASLLPSKAFRALCKQAVVALARREDSECAELRTEFAIPWLNSWVVVLDAKSETLASWIGDSAGAGCNDRSADKFPGNLVKLIRQSLERPETVEELGRRWRNHPQDMELFEGLAARLEEMQAFGKLKQFCQDAAADPGLPELQRNEFRIRAFIAGASAATEKLVLQRYL